MNFNNNVFTLLTEEQAVDNQIDVIKKVGTKCAVSDFAILLGATVDSYYHIDGDKSLKGRTGWWHLSTSAGSWNVSTIARTGVRISNYAGNRSGGIRPVLPYSNISNISNNVVAGGNGLLEVEYGEYPQYAVDVDLSRVLDNLFHAGTLKKTGKTYTTDSIRCGQNSTLFCAQEHIEYEHNGKHYVRTKYINTYSYKLSNGQAYNAGDEVWLEVSPIKWIAYQG